ncbi:MAG: helix-turn-helix domain-containing protein [Leptolyngbyaceae cyanobacterium]
MKRQSPDLNHLYREQLAYIGHHLRQVREANALSYEVLAEKTLIRPSLLQAIESAQVNQLPEPVYTRALIRRFGDSLGLDGEALASQYFAPAHGQSSQSFWQISLMPQLRPLHLYAIYAIVIAIAISALSYTLKRTVYSSSSTLPVLEGEAAEEVTLPAEGESDEISSNPEVDAEVLSAAVASAPVRLGMKMEDQSWMRIIADDEVVFEGILKAGEDRTWTAQKQIIIRSGNAGGVLVSFNEGPAKALGQPGMVTEVIYPPAETAQIEEDPEEGSEPE